MLSHFQRCLDLKENLKSIHSVTVKRHGFNKEQLFLENTLKYKNLNYL